MYRYITATSPLKNLMGRLTSNLKGELKDMFTDRPRFQRVKDPDTGIIGQLYQYNCESGAQLAVEVYPFPLEEGKFSVRAYVIDVDDKIVNNTIKILNPKSNNSYKPIPQNKLMEYINRYADDNFEYLGSFNDVDQAEEDMSENTDDGFEAAEYEDEESEE